MEVSQFYETESDLAWKLKESCETVKVSSHTLIRLIKIHTYEILEDY